MQRQIRSLHDISKIVCVESRDQRGRIREVSTRTPVVDERQEKSAARMAQKFPAILKLHDEIRYTLELRRKKKKFFLEPSMFVGTIRKWDGRTYHSPLPGKSR
jgi:hypothetical protein